MAQKETPAPTIAWSKIFSDLYLVFLRLPDVTKVFHMLLPAGKTRFISQTLWLNS